MPPRTLTRQQFLAKRPGGDYQKYLGYLNRNRGPRMAANAELAPYQPWSPERIDEASFRDVLGPADAQLTGLRESTQRRGTFEADRIRQQVAGLTQALLPFRGSAQNIYAGAQGAQSQLGQALSGGLASQGQQLGTELGQKLRAISAPGAQVEGVSGGAMMTGQQAGQAIGGLSSADLERLRGEGGAADAYLGQMPGLVQLMGAKNARDIAEKLALQLADQEGQIRGRVPGMLADARRWYTEREDRKAAARQGILDKRASARQEQIDRQWEAAVLKQAYGMPLTPRDKALINRYGSSPEGVATAGKMGHEIKLQQAKDAAALARVQAQEAAANARKAADIASKSKLQADQDRAAMARQNAADKAAMARKAVDVVNGLLKGNKGSGSASTLFGD